jgi:hypothetical protein
VLAAVNHLLDEWGGHEKLTMRAVANEVGVASTTVRTSCRPGGRHG